MKGYCNICDEPNVVLVDGSFGICQACSDDLNVNGSVSERPDYQEGESVEDMVRGDMMGTGGKY